MWTRVDLKMRAKQAFGNNYWPCVGVSFILAICTYGIGTGNAARSGSTLNEQTSWTGIDYFAQPDHSGSLFAVIFSMIALGVALFILLFGIFVGNVILVGCNRFFVLNQTERPGVGTIFSGFKSGHYSNIVVTMFLMNLFIGLWTLLFIIPGIIKSFEYMMVPYILAENPGMERKEAFMISKRMMTGQKMDAFVLSLSFFGWLILSAATCGLVGIFYVSPYIEATFAELYTVSRIKAFNEGYIR